MIRRSKLYQVLEVVGSWRSVGHRQGLRAECERRESARRFFLAGAGVTGPGRERAFLTDVVRSHGAAVL